MVQKRLWIVYLSLAVLFAILLFICNSIPFSVSGNTLMLIFAIFYLLSLIMAFACSLIAFKGYIETGILTVLLIACALLFYTLSSLMTLEYLHCVINTACLPILFFYWASATFIPLLFFAVSPWQSKIIKSHNARSLIAIFLCIFVSISAPTPSLISSYHPIHHPTH